MTAVMGHLVIVMAMARGMLRMPRAGLLLLLLLLHSAPGRGGPRAKHDKSPDAARLRREHPSDPVKWFDQVNVHFKAGDKAKVRVAGPAARLAASASICDPAR